MGRLRRPGERLKEYRLYLGLTLEEIEAYYKVSASTWSYTETEGKTISSKILDAVSSLSPPPGKQSPNMTWLLREDGPMLAVTGRIATTDENDQVKASGIVGPPVPAHLIPTPGFPDRQIVRATELVLELVGAGSLSPFKMGTYIAILAERLVLGESEEEIRRVQGPAIRSQAYAEVKRPQQLNPS